MAYYIDEFSYLGKKKNNIIDLSDFGTELNNIGKRG